MMSCEDKMRMGEENKTVVRGFIDSMNSNDAERTASFLDRQFTQHGLGDTPEQENKGNTYQMFRQLFTAIPDLRVSIEDSIAEGNKVATRLRTSGTQTGQMGDTPPTGRKVVTDMVQIAQVENGKITDMWFLMDQADVFKQLGVDVETKAPR